MIAIPMIPPMSPTYQRLEHRKTYAFESSGGCKYSDSKEALEGVNVSLHHPCVTLAKLTRHHFKGNFHLFFIHLLHYYVLILALFSSS